MLPGSPGQHAQALPCEHLPRKMPHTEVTILSWLCGCCVSVVVYKVLWLCGCGSVLGDEPVDVCDLCCLQVVFPLPLKSLHD